VSLVVPLAGDLFTKPGGALFPAYCFPLSQRGIEGDNSLNFLRRLATSRRIILFKDIPKRSGVEEFAEKRNGRKADLPE
jgi:hypothetical protein